ncbi:hypothetical protein NPIL_328441 [Nephila pilipes]|uniref:Uncharacterized protein n=1 Tax=Nephila pilipes TaxID=299642 RepID=A0A8X6NU23_NEPPI|nr:hypothetical protein NPIL_328441 [Nephila pilipes]
MLENRKSKEVWFMLAAGQLELWGGKHHDSISMIPGDDDEKSFLLQVAFEIAATQTFNQHPSAAIGKEPVNSELYTGN